MEFYEMNYQQLEESFDLVNKIIYIRKYKIKEIKNIIANCVNSLDNIKTPLN